MNKIIIGMMALTSISAFAGTNNRYMKEFAIFDLTGKCVYGDQAECNQSVLKALQLGATESEIISAVKDEVVKMKNIDVVPVETTKERLQKEFLEADKTFNSTFKDSLDLIKSI